MTLRRRFPRLHCLPLTWVALLAVSATTALPTSALARIIPPPVPPGIEVPPGHKPYLQVHAVGTQDYVCLPGGVGFVWSLTGPRATLFNKGQKQLLTHFLAPNPTEGGIARAAWQHSADTSIVWGQPIASSSDPAYVSLEAVPWVLLQVVGAQEGPKGGHKLGSTTYVQRLQTSGGLSPIAGCSGSTNVGARAFVPYVADYFFYKED